MTFSAASSASWSSSPCTSLIRSGRLVALKLRHLSTSSPNPAGTIGLHWQTGLSASRKLFSVGGSPPGGAMAGGGSCRVVSR